MSIKYTAPYPLKAKLLAWKELNINEVDILTNLYHNGSNNDIYRLQIHMKLIRFIKIIIKIYF